VRDLVQAVGSVERPEFLEFLPFRETHIITCPITGDLLGVLFLHLILLISFLPILQLMAEPIFTFYDARTISTICYDS
jgi:hypothetical protein